MDILEPEEEYEKWLERQEKKKEQRGLSLCINTEEDYILWKKRKGRLAKEGGFKVENEEECAWEARMAEGKEQRVILGSTLETPQGQEGGRKSWICA
jgi:hypothetical protein